MCLINSISIRLKSYSETKTKQKYNYYLPQRLSKKQILVMFSILDAK
jgi:hypothetical protein